jgi:hypothetical protein
MKVGDLVREGWGCNALVLKIDGHPCYIESLVTIRKADGETTQRRRGQLQIVSTVHNPYISGNKKTK